MLNQLLVVNDQKVSLLAVDISVPYLKRLGSVTIWSQGSRSRYEVINLGPDQNPGLDPDAKIMLSARSGSYPLNPKHDNLI